MKPSSDRFAGNAHAALRDANLQHALRRVGPGFINRRRQAIAQLDDFESLRRDATAIRNTALENLGDYLQQFEQAVTAEGGQVHWAETATDANCLIVDICRSADARSVIKGKTMVGEEVGLNEALEAAGFDTVETDLGEYIIQLAKEPPSHIIAPAIHKTRKQITELFEAHHASRPAPLESVADIVNEARGVLRQKYLDADVGITGANFLVAETGSVVLVTNEGNGDLCSTLPRTHIVVAGIEKIVPTLDDASVLLRLLARSATGQAITAYTSFFSGARRSGQSDGPADYHVVLVDNGRSEMRSGWYRDMLRCIRCGACLNHCPVYGAIGGHAYGWVYPGPMGAVLTPLLLGLDKAADLPSASTLCGRCEEVCPVSIPLPRLLREHRNAIHQRRLDSPVSRIGLRLWAAAARRPRLYRWFADRALALLSRWSRNGRMRRLPGLYGWTGARDFPAAAGTTFMSQWRKRRQGKES